MRVILGCLVYNAQMQRGRQVRVCRRGGTRLGSLFNLSLCEYSPYSRSEICAACSNPAYETFRWPVLDERGVVAVDTSDMGQVEITCVRLDDTGDKADRWVVGIPLQFEDDQLAEASIEAFEWWTVGRLSSVLNAAGLWLPKTFGLHMIQVGGAHAA